ncbi:Alpha/Beta hydrolase protein [Cladorrhinum sp. PSN259]|nr:Alpha/Beta hydrolase protein [Cladorrhinum sp. PSN259]
MHATHQAVLTFRPTYLPISCSGSAIPRPGEANFSSSGGRRTTSCRLIVHHILALRARHRTSYISTRNIAMGQPVDTALSPQSTPFRTRGAINALIVVGLIALLHASTCGNGATLGDAAPQSRSAIRHSSPYGKFPVHNDQFNFLPCTDFLSLPPLDDRDPKTTWSHQFDANPDNWSWGNQTNVSVSPDDPYAGRAIFLCGYLDLPLDYLNDSDPRIVRLAVTKLQISGLARLEQTAHSQSTLPGTKSMRTIVINPGGPGGSGTFSVWNMGAAVSNRFSDGRFDVLGWDPRGVNASLPSAICFPHDADRDRWSLLQGQYRETIDSRKQLELADAMNNSTFHACHQRLGDLGRFISTASVARDLEEIRKALNETELTGYFISYGTGIAQTFANMFPDSVGRLILDGCEYVKDHRHPGLWGWTSLDNVTDAWHDGFLGECVKAGPKNCALARSTVEDRQPVTLHQLELRMTAFFESMLHRPVPSYSELDGPSLVTYQGLVLAIYMSLYDPTTWPATAQMFQELEAGNSTLAGAYLGRLWDFQPSVLCSVKEKHSSIDLAHLVICADAYDSPVPEGGLMWWDQFWSNMTNRSWISGNSRFLHVLSCRHFTSYWPQPSEVYRGDLNHTLRNPVLLVATTYDPATPLRNGKRLLAEMGHNARLVVHHGYGHTSISDPSNCTDTIGKGYMLSGLLPDEPETNCRANGSPYLI